MLGQWAWPVVSTFGLLLAGVLITAFVIWGNRVLTRQDQQVVIRWLQARRCQVQDVQWVLYYPVPARLWLQRCSTFEARYSDASGAQHHAFIAVPMWGHIPTILEDKVVPA